MVTTHGFTTAALSFHLLQAHYVDIVVISFLTKLLSPKISVQTRDVKRSFVKVEREQK